jgi:hypothetical protein
LGDSPRSTPARAVPRLLAAVGILFWMFLILCLFYLTHKPFGGGVLARWLDVLILLATAGWMAFLAVGIGRRLAPVEGHILERTALAGAMGLGILGLLAFGLTVLGWNTGPALAVLWGLLTLVFLRDSLRWMRELGAGILRVRPRGGPFAWLIAIFAAVTLAFSLGVALCPPVAWDALVYHLQIPQQMTIHQTALPPGDSFFREMPNLSEWIFAGPMALTGRPEAGAVAGWLVGALTLAGIAGTARRTGIRHAWLAPVILLSGDTLARSMGWGYVDWTTALFGYSAVCLISLRSPRVGTLFLAGVLAGFAWDSKYTAGILLPVLLVWILLRDRKSHWLRNAAALLAGFLLAFLPLLFRNLAYWGNPLPPLLDSGTMEQLRMRFFTGSPLPNAGLVALVLPFLQSTIGRYEAGPFGATIGPLLLAFLPGVFAKRRPAEGTDPFPLGLTGLCAIAFWAVSGVGVMVSAIYAQPRLFMVLFPALALLAAYGFDGLWEYRIGKVRVGAVAGALAGLILLIQLAGGAVAWVQAGVPGYLAGVSDRTAYLETNLGWYSRAMDALRALPSDSRVLLLWEPRGLYCGGVCQADATIDRWYLAMRLGETSEEVIPDWRERGFTHILIFNSGADFERSFRAGYLPADWEELDRLRALLIPDAEFGAAYTLYRVPSLD